MDVVLGADIGTTATKVLACRADGTVVARTAAHGYPLLEPDEGHAVQSPDVVLAAAADALREATAAAGAAGGRIVGVCLSSAMHSLIGVDDGGAPVTPLITWADTRAAATATRIAVDHPSLHRRTGTPVHPMSPLVKLAHLHEHDAATVARVHRWVGIKELVVERLTGTWLVDASVASATGLVALGRQEYDAEALSVAGVDASALSPVAAVTAQAGPVTAAGCSWSGVPAGAVVVLGAGDGPLANLGAGATRPGVAAVSIGTSGALRVTVDTPRIDDAGRLFCFASTPGRWVVGGAINNGGHVLAWAGDALTPDLDSPEALLALAATAPVGSDGLLMLPYLLGERAPRWDTLPSAAYVGLRRTHGRRHLLRAALEGVCQQLALILDAVRAAGHPVDEVRAGGGFATGELWPQILADCLGMDVGLPAGHEGSAHGAALLGLWALGLGADPDIAAGRVTVDRVVRAEARAVATYAAQRPIFAGLSDALAPAWQALDALR
ncbi:gluconokinase [Paraconexibacter sp. AEG42_29]